LQFFRSSQLGLARPFSNESVTCARFTTETSSCPQRLLHWVHVSVRKSHASLGLSNSVESSSPSGTCSVVTSPWSRVSLVVDLHTGHRELVPNSSITRTPMTGARCRITCLVGIFRWPRALHCPFPNAIISTPCSHRSLAHPRVHATRARFRLSARSRRCIESLVSGPCNNISRSLQR